MKCPKTTARFTFLPFIAVFTMTQYSVAVAQSDMILNAIAGRHDVIQMDLDIALKYALSQSWRVARICLDLSRDEYNLEASRAGLKSNASLSFTLPDFDQSIKEIINPDTGNPKVLSTKGARYMTSIAIRQPLLTDGVVSLNGVFNRTQDMLFSYSPGMKTYNSKVYVRFDQPILQPNAIKNDIRRAELRLEETRNDFIDERLDIFEDVAEQFFDLYEYVCLDILAREEVAQLDSVFTAARQCLQSGTLSENDLLQLEVELADRRDRASAASGKLAREKSDFKQLIGLTPDDEIQMETSLTFTPLVIELPVAVRRALEERIEVREYQIDRELNQMELVEERAEGSVKGEVSLALGLEGRGDNMDDLYGAMTDPDQTRGVAISLAVPLWDWGRVRARANAKQSELDKVNLGLEETKKNIQRQIRDTLDRVQEAKQRLDLLEPSVGIARRSFQLSLDQFRKGMLDAQDVILTQNRLAGARRSILNAYIDYQQALSTLMRRTSWDWYRDRPLTETLQSFAVENWNG